MSMEAGFVPPLPQVSAHGFYFSRGSGDVLPNWFRWADPLPRKGAPSLLPAPVPASLREPAGKCFARPRRDQPFRGGAQSGPTASGRPPKPPRPPKQIGFLKQQNRKLRDGRDLLLPRLMSREIAV